MSFTFYLFFSHFGSIQLSVPRSSEYIPVSQSFTNHILKGEKNLDFDAKMSFTSNFYTKQIQMQIRRINEKCKRNYYLWIVTWSRWTHSVRGCVCVCWFVVTLLMCARTHLFRSLSLPPSEFCLKDKTNDRIEIREQGIYVTTYITYVHKQAGWHIHERAY